MPSVRFGNRRISLPASRLGRTILGIGLILGGCMWFLPVLGLWMLPLGFIVLSVDSPLVRKWRRQQTISIGRRWGPLWERLKRRFARSGSETVAATDPPPSGGPDAPPRP